MRVSEHSANAWLFSADGAAASSVEDLIRGAAGDWHTLFGPTLDVAFDTSAEGAVDRRPHVALPVDLVAHAAVLDLLHFDVGEALVTAVVALTRAGLRAALPANHRGILAGTGGAVVMFKRGAVLIDFTVEQTASQRQVEHFSLAYTSGAALSRGSVGEVAGTGQDWAHLPHAQSTASSAGAFDTGLPLRTELLLFFVQTTLEDTTGAGGAALFGVDLWVFTVNHTLHFSLCHHSLLTAPTDARFGGSGPVVCAVVGSAVQHATFTAFTAGSCLLHHQSAVLRHQRTLLLLTVGLALQAHTGDAGVVGDVRDVQHLSFIVAACLSPCN